MWKRGLLALAVATWGAVAFAAIDEKMFTEARQLRERGEFDKATQMLQSYLEQTSATLEAQEKRTVEFEIERMRRIRMDYKLTREALLAALRKRVPDLSDEEFERYEKEGRFDILVIDGQKYYVNASASNLLLQLPELRKRETNRTPRNTYRRLYAHMQRVQEAYKRLPDRFVFPQDFEVTYTLVVNANAAPEGKTLRCWLPYVRAYPFHTDAYVTSADPPTYVMAPPHWPHRTVYMEKLAVKDSTTTFSLSFIFRSWARASQVDPALVQPYKKEGPDYAYYTASVKPHLDLENEDLKRLSSEIVGAETNPYLIAQSIYKWIAQNTIYQYAREYSTLDNISLYCASRRGGDCGQHGMLFIALCRLNGIPARWETGWESFDYRGQNMHDWCAFFVEPYGWLPADPDMAVNVLRYSDAELTTTQSQELADWMFGNMDHFRLAVNSEFGAPLFPPKNDFRSETVDFQRGEVEYDNQNLYFDQWDYTMRIKSVSAEYAAAIAKTFQPPDPGLPPLPVKADAQTTAPPTFAAAPVTTAPAVSPPAATHAVAPGTTEPVITAIGATTTAIAATTTATAAITTATAVTTTALAAITTATAAVTTGTQ